MENQEEKSSNQFKIRLSAAIPEGDIARQRAQSVVFDVTPELVENRNVNYKSFDPVHAPGQIYVYNNTAARTFQLSNIKLISRTSKEASINLARLWTLRSWTLPNFGQSDFQNGTAQSEEQQKLEGNMGSIDIQEYIRQMSGQTADRNFLGAPPAILYLSAFSRFGSTPGAGPRSIGHLRNVPVVITQLSIPYPTDVDYIPSSENPPTPMPTIMTLDIQLTESHSPNEYEQFSLQSFRNGVLPGF